MLTRLLFLRMSYFKWMHISKKWLSRFFLCSGMKLEFLFLTGIKYSFWTGIIDLLLVCLALKCELTRSFFTPLTVFRCASRVTRKFCTYVLNM